MSTTTQIARDIRRSPSYATEAVVEHLFKMGYSKTGHPSHTALLLDIKSNEGDFTPDHVAEHLHSLGYSKGPRLTSDEVREAFKRGLQRWHDDSEPKDTLEVYWAEELGVKVIQGTRIPGGV